MMRYDIPTLLALSQNAHIDINRFSAQALGNDLLRQHRAEKSVLSERPPNRSRNTSNISRQSHEARSFSGPRLRNPYRQPSDPPRGVLAQADAGFARFLKEHASPKHQRVTAGGRIVPMDSQEPPPQMKLLINPQTQDKLSSLSESKGKGKMRDIQAQPVENSRQGPNQSVPSQTGGILASHARLSSMSGKANSQTTNIHIIPDLPTAVQPNMACPLGNHQISDKAQLAQESHVPRVPDQIMYHLGGFPLLWIPGIQALNPSQGVFSSLMPSISQVQSSSLSTPSEFASNSSFLGGIPSSLGQSSSIPESFVSTSGLHEYQSIPSQIMTANQPILSTVPSLEASLWKSLNQVTTDYVSLSTQLTELDRYMAMHTWDLEPRVKRSLVEQRKSLVRELDVVRSYKEQLETTLRVSISSGIRKGTNPGLSRPSNTHFPEIFVANEYFPGMASSSMHYTTHGYPLLIPDNSLAQWSSQIQSVNRGFSWQANHGTFEGSDLATSGLSHNGGCTRQIDRASGDRLNSITSFRKPATEPQGQAIEEDEWVPSSAAAPIEIRDVYKRMEDATRKGEPIDCLLEELSQVTTQLMMMHNRQNFDNQTHLTSPLLDKQGNFVEDVGKLLSTNRVYDNDVHESVMGHSRRPWASEHLVRRSSIRLPDTPLNIKEDDDSESATSYTSTTDSWATVRSEEKSYNDGSGQKNPMAYPESTRPLYPSLAAAIIGTHTPCSLETDVSRLESSGEATQASQPSIPSIGQKRFSAESRTEIGRQANPHLLTQYLNKDRGLTFQKATALAVPQNVNAHAVLPPFDTFVHRPFLSVVGLVDDR